MLDFLGVGTQCNEIEYFWMDTLCIPRFTGEQDHKVKPLRNIAIDQMDYVYGAAQDILVLDPELRSIESEGLSPEQKAASIIHSPWLSRCWTFQEGCLAPTLNFAFQDQVIPMCKITLWPLCDWGVNDWIWPAIRYDMLGLLEFKHPSDRNRIVTDRFIGLWNGLSQRSTSRPTDLHRIFALLLGLSSTEVCSRDITQRMKALLRSQNVLPLELLYDSSEDRIVDDADNSWVPRYPATYLQKDTIGQMTPDPAARGLVLRPDDGHEIYLVDEATSPSDQQNLAEEIFYVDSFCVQTRRSRNTDLTRKDYPVKTCFMFHQNLALKDSQGYGARFYVVSQRGQKYDLVYDCPVTVKLRSSSTSACRISNKAQFLLLSGGSNSIIAAVTVLLSKQTADFNSWFEPSYKRSWSGISTPYFTYVLLLLFFTTTLWFIFGLYSLGLEAQTPAMIYCIFAIFALRVIIAFVFESTCVAEKVGTWELEAYAASLLRSSPSRPSVSSQPDRGPSYQYNPEWIAGALAAAGFGVAGLGYALGATVPALSGLTLSVETAVRFGAERLWRRTRFGWFGKRLLASVGIVLVVPGYPGQGSPRGEEDVNLADVESTESGPGVDDDLIGL